MTHVILDGTLIESDRLAGVRENGNDLWFSQKHKAFGGNVQFLSAPDGTPLWGSDVEPGSTPDITAHDAHLVEGISLVDPVIEVPVDVERLMMLPSGHGVFLFEAVNYPEGA